MNITKKMIEDFERGNEVWHEIKVLLGERLEVLYGVLSHCPKDTIWHTDKDGRVYATRGVEFYQGAIEEIQGLVTAPEKLIYGLDERKEEDGTE